jgi:hypothetical protein
MRRRRRRRRRRRIGRMRLFHNRMIDNNPVILNKRNSKSSSQLSLRVLSRWGSSAAVRLRRRNARSARP